MTARVTVVATEHVGTRMAGPGIRSLRFATELANDHEVTLVVPFATDVQVDGFSLVQDDPWDARSMRVRLRHQDVVVAQQLPISTMRQLARSTSTTAIYDLYAPLSIESLALAAARPASRATALTQRMTALTQEVALACGDAFVCASEQQRDLWLGGLLALGRIDQRSYGNDPSLREMIDVVPFGIDPEPAPADRPVLKGVVPGIEAEDNVLLWGGGIWNWFDPLTVIRAVDVICRERDDVRLFFLGSRHPNPAVPAMEMQERAIALAEELGLRDDVVVFNEGWVPYEQRAGYFLEADLGVSAHFDDLETRFAYRTRLLDCIWAGLPILATGGDALGDLVDREEIGKTVAVGDVDGWARGIVTLLDDEQERDAIRGRMNSVRERLVWARAVAPLKRLITSAGSCRARLRPDLRVRYARARAENAFLQHGLVETIDLGLRHITHRKRPLEERVWRSLR